MSQMLVLIPLRLIEWLAGGPPFRLRSDVGGWSRPPGFPFSLRASRAREESGPHVRIIPLGVGRGAYGTELHDLPGRWGRATPGCSSNARTRSARCCGQGSHAAGLPLDLDRVSGVGASHLHADHSSGLEDFGFYAYYALGRRARVLAHPEVSANLWDGLLSGGMGEDRSVHGPGKPPVIMHLDDYFEVTALSESRPSPFGPFSIECRLTHHSIATTAFRITAAGRTSASPPTPPSTPA